MIKILILDNFLTHIDPENLQNGDFKAEFLFQHSNRYMSSNRNDKKELTREATVTVIEEIKEAQRYEKLVRRL